MRSRIPTVIGTIIVLVFLLFSAFFAYRVAAQAAAGAQTFIYLSAPMQEGGPPRYELLEQLLKQQNEKK
jgi:hypothetical protein